MVQWGGKYDDKFLLMPSLPTFGCQQECITLEGEFREYKKKHEEMIEC